MHNEVRLLTTALRNIAHSSKYLSVHTLFLCSDACSCLPTHLHAVAQMIALGTDARLTFDSQVVLVAEASKTHVMRRSIVHQTCIVNGNCLLFVIVFGQGSLGGSWCCCLLSGCAEDQLVFGPC